MQGWIKLHRTIQENEFYFSERFTKTQAWVDLLLLANHKAATVFIRGIEIHLQPGELCYSQLTLAKRWKWNFKTVVAFLKMLSKRQMLETRITNVTSLISIKNWKKYQMDGGALESRTETKTESRTETNKNDKNEENVVRELIEHLKNNNIDVNEEELKIRVPKGLADYGEPPFRAAVNNAVESWRKNSNEGNFIAYLFKTLEHNYKRNGS